MDFASVQNGSQRFAMVPNGSQRFRTVLNGCEWYSMVANGTAWFRPSGEDRQKIGTRHQGPGNRERQRRRPGVDERIQVIGRSNPQGLAAQRLVDFGPFANLCESLRIVANLCESLRIVANRCRSLRRVAFGAGWFRPAGKRARPTRCSVRAVRGWVAHSAGKHARPTRCCVRAVRGWVSLRVLLPIADLLNCVIAEFRPSRPAGGQGVDLRLPGARGRPIIARSQQTRRANAVQGNNRVPPGPSRRAA